MRLLLLLTCFIISSPAFSSNQTGKVTHILVRDDGLHWFYIEGERNEKPQCAKNNYWMIKDEHSVYGKSQFSLLLSAYMSDSKVIITGKSSCERWGDGETIGTVQLTKK
ncbi:hypothetical protein [Vibrio jasicida]|uniref:hypothetical protein n=1 Tax=Vibrio jasicida TaxID=766224 RepID=UPI000CE41350|nr:hypothetical protein [Vibrio jasicida]